MKTSRGDGFSVALAALCPVLLACGDLVSGVIMGLAFLLLLFVTTLSLSLCRRLIAPGQTLAILLLTCASWACCIDLLMQAWFYEIRLSLGIYLPLLAMNGFILLAIQQTALLKTPVHALRHNLGNGLILFVIICAVSALREMFGNGALFSNASLLPFAGVSTFTLDWRGMNILNSPAAVFILLGLMCPFLQKLFRHSDQSN